MEQIAHDVLEDIMTEITKDMTPMMVEYLKTKHEYEDCILFYRLGDFYEMFFDDAIVASKELELTLTGKSCGMSERAPMCGVPFHAAETYISRLISKGFRVAICEQVEDPKLAKGLVKREVIRIVTPGTNLNTVSLDERKNNYLMCVAVLDETIGICAVDVLTGDFFMTEVNDTVKLYDEIGKFSPSEIICNNAFTFCGLDMEELREKRMISVYCLPDSYFDNLITDEIILSHFGVSSKKGLGIEEFPSGSIAVGAILKYLYETQKTSLTQLTHLSSYKSGNFMMIDQATRRNLELTETLRDKQKSGSLLYVLDKTKTAMGGRLLRSRIEQPLIDRKQIETRLDAVSELLENHITREELREYLNAVYDLERLLGKVTYKSANPRDLLSFASSLSMIPPIRTLIKEFTCSELKNAYNDLDELRDICTLITDAIYEDSPVTIKEGGIIKTGYNEEIDLLRNAKTEGKNWLANLEAREKERTGIKNLRIGYNRVFGYYLEATNSYKGNVPDDWIRKQTLSNAERYTTAELKEIEDRIINAEDRLFSLEYSIFSEIRDTIAENVLRIQKTAHCLALIDVYCSLAHVSCANNYVRPELNTGGIIDIKGGRHPVVEKMLKDNTFVENDTYLNNDDHRLAIITGPNMAGKSTYMRQTALIVYMAQIGCFVPAVRADIGIVDRIFTRVGASDDLTSGQSTFMVEMTEVANILRNATRNSLLILDEIGRGTSTFDGLSIAWAVIEHISDTMKLGAKTLFATHYHELTELEGKLEGVNNYCIAVKEQGDTIVFLRKIISGGADKSYGIEVARLAGVPSCVLDRAKEILTNLSENDDRERIGSCIKATPVSYTGVQMSLFGSPENSEVINTIGELDLSALTPIDALNTLYKLQKMINT